MIFAVIFVLAAVGLPVLAVAITVWEHRTAPDRRLIAAERRARWEARQ